MLINYGLKGNWKFCFSWIIKNNVNWEIKFYKKKNWTEIDFVVENWKWQIIPIEIKSSNSIAIPKIFYSFNKEYASKIKFFVRTTKDILEKKEIMDKQLLFVPNFLIGKIWF